MLTFTTRLGSWPLDLNPTAGAERAEERDVRARERSWAGLDSAQALLSDFLLISELI